VTVTVDARTLGSEDVEFAAELVRKEDEEVKFGA
jgi:hypothetical protein